MSGIIAGLQGRVIDPAAPPNYGAVQGQRAPVSVDQNGRLVIAGTTNVVGTTTPGDAVPNPNTCIDTRTFLQLWDPVTAQWKRSTAQAMGNVVPAAEFGMRAASQMYASDSYYAGNIAPLMAEWLGVTTTNVYALRTTVQAPHGFSGVGASQVARVSAPANTGVLRAAAARVTSIQLSLTDVSCFFCVVNKATNPANNDAILYARPISSGLSLQANVVTIGRDFFGDAGIWCSAGFAWCLSTTHTIVTLAAVPGAISIEATYS